MNGCLNPCFNGVSQLVHSAIEYFIRCLNPCFNGVSQLQGDYDMIQIVVLILVLMEYHSAYGVDVKLILVVLILVLMEYHSLALTISSKQLVVLILVLMEYHSSA